MSPVNAIERFNLEVQALKAVLKPILRAYYASMNCVSQPHYEIFLARLYIRFSRMRDQGEETVSMSTLAIVTALWEDYQDYLKEEECK